MPLAIVCGTLIDGTGAEPVRNAVILVDGHTITEVRADGTIPAGADIVDASALTVMPGLIDAHVHLMSNPPKTMEQRLGTPFSLQVAEALANARTSLEHGFTTVRDAGGTPRGVKMAIDQGLFPGPRLRISVGALSQTGGHGDATMANGSNTRGGGSYEIPNAVCDGVDGVRRATREMLRAGADQIKIMTSGGVTSPNDEPGATGFTPEEIAAVVHEAHAAHKTVMSHAQAAQGILNAVLAGVESIEHGIYLNDHIVAEMKARGTFLVATLIAPVSVLKLAEAHPGSMASWSVRKTHDVMASHQASFKFAQEQGVRIAFGTDTGVGVHGTNAGEFQLMLDQGMSPMAAIVSATKTAAECVRVDHLVGTIEPGKRADIIGVAGDPLADIRILEAKAAFGLIMKDGKAFKGPSR